MNYVSGKNWGSRLPGFLTRTLFTDDPKVFNNAPVSLQLVGGVLEEEAVIAMTEIVDQALANFKRASPQL
jgi:Asp-tRNA(Asn)/Glu-tRNA(Gln) amidotransferase A subunit family amidase